MDVRKDYPNQTRLDGGFDGGVLAGADGGSAVRFGRTLTGGVRLRSAFPCRSFRCLRRSSLRSFRRRSVFASGLWAGAIVGNAGLSARAVKLSANPPATQINNVASLLINENIIVLA